ncbi:MAG: toll/interleukin-1 receptor domain-containing protein [Oscillospiraceae bacterium]|nr:toll/interleukin-1 receptor domain-containing protein [Oscillospiraceae bacterium]
MKLATALCSTWQHPGNGKSEKLQTIREYPKKKATTGTITKQIRLAKLWWERVGITPNNFVNQFFILLHFHPRCDKINLKQNERRCKCNGDRRRNPQQGMKIDRPDMDIFFDVDSLRSGEDWETTLYREIDRRDILCLCWSEYARESKWVDTEWRYALSNKGLDGIEPVPLVFPEVCPPPEELKSKHFNDKALLYNAIADKASK